jgi:plastocyanin
MFDEPGTYEIRCRPHSNMRQTVEVVGPGSGAPASAESEMRQLAFEPRTLTIEAGGTVTWINYDRQAHDVDIWRESE